MFWQWKINRRSSVIGTVRPFRHMITRNEAESIATEHVASMSDVCVKDGFYLALTSEATLEYDFGWVFFYDSTDPDQTPIAGNAPFIVERESGDLVTTGTADSIEHYIHNYRTTGDPHGRLGLAILITGYQDGARKIEATKSLREHVGIGLADAKCIVERCMDGATIEVTAKSDDDAAMLYDELKTALFNCERLPEKKGEPCDEPKSRSRRF